jgi:glycosyltransferase involved in cell wall biosynthesis
MRIVQIITLTDLGGAQSVVVSLSNKLCEKHEVVVIGGEGTGKMWQNLDIRIRQIRIKSLKRVLSPVCDFLTFLAFIKLKFQLKPDIVHLHSSKAGILGRLAFPSSKIIYTVHGFDSIRVAYRRFLPLEKCLQKFCKAIVGVSKYDERNMLKEGIKHHVNCIYNGIFKPDRLEENPLEFLKGYKSKVLCIARLSPPKNSDLFIEIASLLPDYAFIWIGNLCEYKGFKPQNVFFLGNISNAGAYNEYVDIFVLPSNYEGLPIVIIEAMSFGRPIVASNVGGISEIVFNDQNGYVVENKPNDFAEKIDYILKNKNIYKSFSEKSLEIYEKNLTVDKMVEKYMNIYNQV